MRWITTQCLVKDRDEVEDAEARGMANTVKAQWSPMVLDLLAVEAFSDDGTHDHVSESGKLVTERVTHICTRGGLEVTVRIAFPDFDTLHRMNIRAKSSGTLDGASSDQ